MHRRFPTLALGLIVAMLAACLPATAARPILDYHRLDAYFALFARDSDVPWKPTTIRMDTYTDAPVDFAAYQVDPADVIVAGSNVQPRAIDTAKRKPIATWRFVPPGGYRFQTSDIDVPLGSREGFFVVEARRGGVGEQVWINRTRVGLLTKETPSGIAIYGVDLGTGRPLAHLRVSFIAGGRFIDRYTANDGLTYWHGNPRPVFALAQWGNSYAFVSFLPQAPLPRTIVGVKTDSAVVHAGDDLHVVGFARSRSGSLLRASHGEAAISLRSDNRVVAQRVVHLDTAGAFAAALHVPESSSAGEYTVMATVDGATAGTMLHVDANSDGLSLAITPKCEGTGCNPGDDVPIVVSAQRGGVAAADVPIEVDVIRSPHAFTGQPAQAPWGVAQWYQTTVRTGGDGRALVQIPHPTDGLPSTYGVRVRSGGATADTRILVPTARVALQLQLQQDDIGSGIPANFDLSANEISGGKPAGGLHVRVQLVHGSSAQDQTVTLDAQGRAHGAFTSPEVGSNLIVASADVDGRQTMDAAQLQVEPQMMEMEDAQGNSSVTVALDKDRYFAGGQARVEASLPGAQGDALLSLENANGAQLRVVPVGNDRATTSFNVADAPGVLAAGAAFVRDGTLQWSTVPIVLDAPGRPLSTPLHLDKAAYLPGALARVSIEGVRPGEGTLIVRISKSAPTGSAVFSSAPDLLAIGTTATQDTAIGGASWHPWVDSTGDHPVIQTFTRRTAPPDDLTMTQADTASVYWNVDEHAGNSLDVPVPATSGKYVISLLKVDDDGRVTAASGDVLVQ